MVTFKNSKYFKTQNRGSSRGPVVKKRTGSRQPPIDSAVNKSNTL